MPRAFWRGHIKLSLVTCAVALYPAVSKAKRPRFHRIHRQTGARLRQQMVEPETMEPVQSENMTRGFELPASELLPARARAAALQTLQPSRPLMQDRFMEAPERLIEVSDEELAGIEAENTHTIDIEHFVSRDEIDDRYLNSAYYAIPTDRVAQEAYAVIRDAMRERSVAALARIVLTRREHVIMLEPFGRGLLGVTLRYPYEVRDDAPIFERIGDVKLPKEMKDLALHIVDRMRDRFDPSKIEDRYKQALDKLIAAKASTAMAKNAGQGPAPAQIIDLMDALRASAGEKLKPKRGRSHRR